MKLENFLIFLTLSWSAIIGCEKVTDEFGIFENVINKILESSRPYLTNLFIKAYNFETGRQEFGDLKGNFREITFIGLEKFRVKLLNTTFLDINNLTILEESFTAKGFYQLNGTLAFPLGKSDIHFFGDGKFRAIFNGCSVSVKMMIRLENGVKIVKDLDIVVGLERMEVYFENLMGGGKLEKVFNQLMNDVGLTVFNYYEEAILNTVELQIKQIINEMLNAGKRKHCRVKL